MGVGCGARSPGSRLMPFRPVSEQSRSSPRGFDLIGGLAERERVSDLAAAAVTTVVGLGALGGGVVGVRDPVVTGIECLAGDREHPLVRNSRMIGVISVGQ